MSYSIIRFKKIKENLILTELAGHNFRLDKKTTRSENIDEARSNYNQILINKFNIKKPEDLQIQLNEYYNKLGIKVKKNNVLAIDLIATTSPEFWGEDWALNLNTQGFKGKLKEWYETQVNTVKTKFGEDAVKMAVLHLDETTPHIHFLITPEEKKEVIFKNRYGVSKKYKHILNNNRWNPEFFTELVNENAKANEKFGLVRGEVGSHRAHTPLKDYKSALEKAERRAKKLGDSYARALEDDDAQKALIIQLSKDNQVLARKNKKLEEDIAKLKAAENIKNGYVEKEDLEALGL